MLTALQHSGDKKEITANYAAAKNIRRAICPDCGDTVNLHAKRKPTGQPSHFEHPKDARKGVHALGIILIEVH
jgi:hypothetical protein